MSKKINPIILRLGIKTSWISKYYEKKTYDFKNFSFYQLELKKFIKLFFKKFNLKLKHCKIYYKKNSLHFFITYNTNSKFSPKNSNTIKNKLSNESIIFKKFYKKYRFKLLKSTNKLVKKYLRKSMKYTKFLHFFSKKHLKYKNYFTNFFKFRKYLEKKLKFNSLSLTNKNLNLTNLHRFYVFKSYYLLKTFKFNTNTVKNLFFKRFLIVVKMFLKNNTNVFITFKQFNKNNFKNIICNKQKIKFIINLTSLKKFQYYSFFEPGINLLFNFLNNNNNFNLSCVISNFIANELLKIKDLKLLNLFLKFVLNKIKYFLIISKKINGIEIKIKGNLNKSQRAVIKTIFVGKKISKLLLNNNLFYKESVAYTKKGTFGVKTWVF